MTTFSLLLRKLATFAELLRSPLKTVEPGFFTKGMPYRVRKHKEKRGSMYSFTCYLHKHMQEMCPLEDFGYLHIVTHLNKSSWRNLKFSFVVTKRHNKDTLQIKNLNLCTCFGILILLLKSNFHKERTRTTAISNFPVETSQKFLYTSLKVCPFKK